MPTVATVDFFQIALWLGYTAIAALVLTIAAFVFGWGIRFRLVGITSFMVVLVIGSLGLGLGLFQRTEIPGAIRYSLVYDNGGAQVVLSLNPKEGQVVDRDSLEATLKQAAYNLFSPSRFSSDGRNVMTIRLRTLDHSEPGISKPVLLGQVERSLSVRDDDQMKIKVYPERLPS